MENRLLMQDFRLFMDKSDTDFVVVGSPKGVGFTTYMSEFIANQIFFHENTSILVLADCRKEQINILFKIKKAYAEFGLFLETEDGCILYEDNSNGSSACVLNYREQDLSALEGQQYDIIIVDRDDCSNYLYGFIDVLYNASDLLIFNTYDLPHSIFYNLDSPKVVVRSEYSKENIRKNRLFPSSVINEDRIIWGVFTGA